MAFDKRNFRRNVLAVQRLPVHFGGRMKMLLQTVGLALTAAVLAGCSSQPKVYYHAGDETPPDFLAGPLAVLFTNVDGFSAKMTRSVALADGSRRSVTG